MCHASSQPRPASSIRMRISSGITRAGWVSLIWMTFFSWKFFRVPYGLDVLACDGLHGGGNEEILLLQPQGLALIVVVLGIEHLGDDVRHGLLLRRPAGTAPWENSFMSMGLGLLASHSRRVLTCSVS